MYQKDDKKPIWRLAALFFGAMVVFTLLSRAAYQRGTAVVKTAAPSRGTITHQVRLSGKAVQNQDLAVTTVGGLRVGSVHVTEGQKVAQGELLFTLDLEYLDEAILKQTQEMKKQKLSIQDAWSKQAAAQKQQANQKAQAQENYDSAISQGEKAVKRAEERLRQAQKALEDFQKGATQGQTLHQALEAQVAQRQADYQAAVEARKALENTIEQKIQEALEEAKQQLPPQVPAETQPEAPSAPIETEAPTQAPPETEAPIETEAPTTAPPETEAPTEAATEGSSASQASGELTAEQIQAISNAVRGTYAQDLTAAKAREADAQKALDRARQELEQWDGEENSPVTEQSLKAAVKEAERALQDAIDALDQAHTTYSWGVKSADLPTGSNSSAQISQITYDQMKLELEKLEQLREAQGKVLAPVEGVVTRCLVQTGEKTGDTTAVLLADLTQGCKFSGVVTREQSQYIAVGDPVELQADSTGKFYRDLTVTTLSTQEEEGGYRLTVQLPQNSLPLGASGQLTAQRRSPSYSCCVPLSALHLDAKNQAYVLVAEPVKTVLGTQMQARKVPVTVLEKNGTTAALEEGAIHSDQQIIVSADRAVDAGSRVRVS